MARAYSIQIPEWSQEDLDALASARAKIMTKDKRSHVAEDAATENDPTVRAALVKRLAEDEIAQAEEQDILGRNVTKTYAVGMQVADIALEDIPTEDGRREHFAQGDCVYFAQQKRWIFPENVATTYGVRPLIGLEVEVGRTPALDGASAHVAFVRLILVHPSDESRELVKEQADLELTGFELQQASAVAGGVGVK